MKIWVDDLRTAPEGYRHVTNVDEAKKVIMQLYNPHTHNCPKVEILDLDHDAGLWSNLGDFIDILKWLEKKQNEKGWVINFPIRIHTMNPVGRENMRAVIQKNGWKEIM